MPTVREANSCRRAIRWATPSLAPSLSPLMTGRKVAEDTLESSGDSSTPKTCEEGWPDPQVRASPAPARPPAPCPADLVDHLAGLLHLWVLPLSLDGVGPRITQAVVLILFASLGQLGVGGGWWWGRRGHRAGPTGCLGGR